MLPDPGMREIRILGDGCAALSLAARATELPSHKITLVRPEGAPPDSEHIWGFWGTDKTDIAGRIARASWSRWAIVTSEGRAEMSSQTRPYHALRRSDWTAHCRQAATEAGVAVLDDGNIEAAPAAQIFDSRPPRVPRGCMLQHFIGFEVRAPKPVFDPETVILMDFRVDQSQGMHFIYLLPFSATEALVESTLFSARTLEEDFYTGAIDSYLERYFGLTSFEILRRERGVIPLATLPRRDPEIPGLGGNGGAIRPSSGYAFIFIQKQVSEAVESAKRTGRLVVKSPHRQIDLWMDAVLLSVLRHWPEHAPDLFMRMARALSGDEFARFLSGEAGWGLRLKVVMAMPKWPFIRATLRLVSGRRGMSPVEAA